MQSEFHRVTFEEYCVAWAAEDYMRHEDRSEYTPEALTDLAATLHADAVAGRGNVELKRKAAACALVMAERLFIATVHR